MGTTEQRYSQIEKEANFRQLPVSTSRLVESHADGALSQVITFCRNGWPNRRKVKEDLMEFWRTRGKHTNR